MVFLWILQLKFLRILNPLPCGKMKAPKAIGIQSWHKLKLPLSQVMLAAPGADQADHPSAVP